MVDHSALNGLPGVGGSHGEMRHAADRVRDKMAAAENMDLNVSRSNGVPHWVSAHSINARSAVAFRPDLGPHPPIAARHIAKSFHFFDCQGRSRPDRFIQRSSKETSPRPANREPALDGTTRRTG